MGIVCSTDDADGAGTRHTDAAAAHTAMAERNEAARLKAIEDRAVREAMRQSARAASQETIDNEGVFGSRSDV